MSLSLSLQTFDSLNCNGNEDLEQLQLEMRDLRHEVRRLKVEPPLRADFLAGVFCCSSPWGLWGGLSLWRSHQFAFCAFLVTQEPLTLHSP